MFFLFLHRHNLQVEERQPILAPLRQEKKLQNIMIALLLDLGEMFYCSRPMCAKNILVNTYTSDYQV